MHKKEVVKIIVFLGLFLCILTMLSYILRTNGGVKNRFASFYAEPKDSIEVMFFGSSCISRAIAPGYIYGEYGIKSYSLSSNSQRTNAILPLIEEAYRYQSPEVIVVDTRVFAYDDDKFAEDEAHMREVTDNMRYSIHRIETINRLTEGTDIDRLSMYLDIFKYHSNIAMLFKKEELSKAFFVKNDIDKGFEADDESFHNSIHKQWEPVTPIPIQDKQELVLRELIGYCKENNINLVFLTSVTLPDPDFMGKAAYMGAVFAQENIPYVNFNELYSDMGLDTRTDVSDGVHCNTIGAKKCSDYIMNYIVKNYKIKGKSDAEADGKWSEAAIAFNEHYEKAMSNLSQVVLREE